MATITTDDGVSLYVEDTGSGTPIVFVHEFAGDHRSWEPQVRHFSRRYRCVTYNARGYPPSQVIDDVDRYSQARQRDDILSVMDALKIERAHVVGLSMGGFATLHLGITHSARALSLTVAGCGYGAHPSEYAKFQETAKANARVMVEQGMPYFASTYGRGPGRTQYRDKDPRGFAEFLQHFGEHSAQGSSLTMLGYQGRRPSLYSLTEDLKKITAPMLVVAGDEDDPTLEPGFMLKRTVKSCALAVLPKCGHVLNLEEPALFNRIVEDFMHQVEQGRWIHQE